METKEPQEIKITMQDVANFLKNEIDKKFNESLGDIFKLMELATKAINLLNAENSLLTEKIKKIETQIKMGY